MKYNDAINQLQHSQPKPVYLLAGTETYLAEQFLNSLLKLINPDGDALQKFDASSSIKSILQSADSPPFFSKRNIIVAKDLKLFSNKLSDKDKKDEQNLLDYLSDPSDFSVLIFTTLSSVDKRRKLFKQIEKCGIIVECEPVAYWNIDNWLAPRIRQMHLNLNREAYAYLSEAVKAMDKISLGFIDQELIKLTLADTNGPINRRTLEQMLSSMPEISSFRLWDALCDKNVATALDFYAIQKSSGLYPLRLLKFLARQMRQLWLVKIKLNDGVKPRQLAPILKVPPFIAERIAAQAQRFSLDKIHETIQLIADADYKLKNGLEEPVFMENIFITFCSK